MTKYKHFFVHAELVSQSGAQGIATLCRFLVDRFYRVGHSLRDAVPVTVILDCEDAVLLEVKRDLLFQRIAFNDGFEHIVFQPWMFDLAPVTNRFASSNGRDTDKIGSASYVLRLIGRKTYDEHKTSLRQPHVCIVTGPDVDGCECPIGETIHLHGVDTHSFLISILQ